jgi:hypothetical protein
VLDDVLSDRAVEQATDVDSEIPNVAEDDLEAGVASRFDEGAIPIDTDYLQPALRRRTQEIALTETDIENASARRKHRREILGKSRGVASRR